MTKKNSKGSKTTYSNKNTPGSKIGSSIKRKGAESTKGTRTGTRPKKGGS